MTRRSVLGGRVPSEGRGRSIETTFLTLLLAVAVLAGCADIPTSGPVGRVADDAGLGESTVRYAPAPPSAGASPEEIVRGYLDAMLAYPMTTGTASLFLTPDAEQEWDAADGVRVYTEPELGSAGRSDDPDAGSEIVVGIEESVRLDRQGRATPVGASATVGYRLEQVDGEWRIANPQPGLMVTERFFADYFRRFDLYWFDPKGERLVAEPVHLAVGERLPTLLMAALTAGPGGALAEETRSYLPDRKQWRPSVPVDAEGVAEVSFDHELESSGVRDRVSAQVVWTLKQVPAITAIRVVGSDGPVVVGGSASQSTRAWGRFGPSSGDTVHAVVDNRVVELGDGEATPVEGPWGEDARAARGLAVRDDRIALVVGNTVVVGRLDDSETTSVPGTQVVSIFWDASGVLWIIDRPADALRVRLVDGDETHTVATGGLDGTTFALSPDEARYAVTEGSRIRVGLVERDGADRAVRLAVPSTVASDAVAPGGTAWTSGSAVAFLSGEGGDRQVVSASIDGLGIETGPGGAVATLPEVGARLLAVGTGAIAERWVVDGRNRLWYLPPGGSWELLDAANVTALG